MWSTGFYIAVSGLAVGISIAVVAILLFIHHRRRIDNDQSSGKKPGGLIDDVELQQFNLSVRTTDKKVSFEGSSNDTTNHPRTKIPLETFTLEELRKATEGFSASNLIGGSVYHGRLGGKSLAVKIVRHERVAKIEFDLLQDGIHKHPNIIRLLGTCLSEEGSELVNSYLIFEYALNGSLKDWIHGGLAIKSQFIASCECFLTWVQRLRICLDIAMALQYMHHIMSPSYIHGNVMAENVFLDEEFNAKIGKFGMPACVEEEAYLAPEFIHHSQASPSMDVFAFGIMLLEVLTGWPPVITASESGVEKATHLKDKINSVLELKDVEEAMKEWIDGAIGDSYPAEGALQLANLAKACTEEESGLRPSAGEVVEVLLRLVEEFPGEAAGDSSKLQITGNSSKPQVKAAGSNTTTI
ncbi:hypothetical protein SAY86_014472 [Trapa natans]|uniref:Protein kinase domain-containing protein n=1 Tax=Trapa natans TaxID=22666 RepID=A0AAN7QN46_TRANT|nr:hypothetical protein SAY86_014472 [Trapa natans]